MQVTDEREQGFIPINIKLESKQELEFVWTIFNKFIEKGYVKGDYYELVEFRTSLWSELDKRLRVLSG